MSELLFKGKVASDGAREPAFIFDREKTLECLANEHFSKRYSEEDFLRTLSNTIELSAQLNISV